MTGLELLGEAKKLRPDMPVVLMTAYASVATAVEAMKLGAYDYIQKPFDGDEIKLLVDRTLEHSRLKLENQALSQHDGNQRTAAADWQRANRWSRSFEASESIWSRVKQRDGP